jgi:hypothetical protein
MVYKLSIIGPRLAELRDFSDLFAEKLGPRLNPGVFWGFLGLTLTVSSSTSPPSPLF